MQPRQLSYLSGESEAGGRPPRLRLRELPATEHPAYRLTHLGPEALSTAELLDLVVGQGQVLGGELLARTGGLHRLTAMSESELAGLPGIGPATAVRLRAALELGRRMMRFSNHDERPQITSPADAAALLMPEMSHLEQEHLRVLLLDTRNRVLTSSTIYKGNVNTIVIRPAEIFREAIRHNSPSLILVHNHPSGDVTPSPEDLRITRQVVEAGELLSIEVLDHLIIGRGCYVSLKERGLMAA